MRRFLAIAQPNRLRSASTYLRDLTLDRLSLEAALRLEPVVFNPSQ